MSRITGIKHFNIRQRIRSIGREIFRIAILSVPPIPQVTWKTNDRDALLSDMMAIAQDARIAYDQILQEMQEMLKDKQDS